MVCNVVSPCRIARPVLLGFAVINIYNKKMREYNSLGTKQINQKQVKSQRSCNG